MVVLPAELHSLWAACEYIDNIIEHIINVLLHVCTAILISLLLLMLLMMICAFIYIHQVAPHYMYM